MKPNHLFLRTYAPSACAIFVLCAPTLFACETSPPQPEPSIVSYDVAATRLTGDRSDFELPPLETAQTDRADLFRLVDALDEAYARLDFAPPFPNVRIVDANNPLFRRSFSRGRTMALAAMNDEGEPFIYFNQKDLQTTEDLLSLVLHELSHLKAWRVYGRDIPAHGREFMAICRKVIRRSDCAARER
ncbi:MAG: SprT-like domain-containing protein [Henriciella sp.]